MITGLQFTILVGNMPMLLFLSLRVASNLLFLRHLDFLTQPVQFMHDIPTSSVLPFLRSFVVCGLSPP